MKSKGQGLGAGKVQKRIVAQLHGSEIRYTSGALCKLLDVPGSSVKAALNGLLEMGAVKADPWGQGFCYRSPHTKQDKPVASIKMRPQIVMSE